MTLLFALLGCTGGEETGETAATVGYAELQFVFDRNCTGTCHAGDEPFEGLVLTEDASWDALVDVPSNQVPTMRRVAPGDPDGSYLLHKLRGTHATVGGTGNAMPPYLVLADSELELFLAWIEGGAER